MPNNLPKLSTDHCWQSSRSLERALFFLIILLEAGTFLYLISGRLIPGGSDGFKYFYLQYYFLNNVVNYGEIPQWVPFMTHGTITTWWYIYQGGLLQDILLLSGGLLKGANFLPVFYTGIFVDHLLLLVGVWLLGKRFFTSPVTVFFVALSIMGSCVWLLQAWWNFHFFYAIPLILYLVHRFLDNGEWRYCFLAGNLLAIQALGGLPYFLPVTSLVIFLYFLFYILFHLKDTWQAIRSLHFDLSFVLTVSINLVLFIALYVAMNSGTDQIQVANLMRNADGSVGLDVFLTYGGNFSWKTWLEMILGVSPAVDYNLYIGIVCVPLILAGIVFNSNKSNMHFLLTAVILLLFSAGTFVSVIFYYCWPMMKYFRHLVLVTPIIKILLCFLAGFGFEAVFLRIIRGKRPLTIRLSSVVIAVLMLGVFTALWHLSHHYEFYVNFYVSMVPQYLPVFLTLFNENLISPLLIRTAFFALASFMLFAGSMLFYRKRSLPALIIIILLLHGADMYSYKLTQIRLKTAPLNDELFKITTFQKMPYAKRRDISFENNNPRASLLDALPIHYGVFYWTTHAFLFKDQLGNPFKTDSWLLPLDQYMRAYWGQPINDRSVKVNGLVYPTRYVRPRLEFPGKHSAALKISGVTEDKIQFFSRAEVVPSEDEIVLNITDPAYKGDILFLSPLEKNIKAGPVSQSEFSENELASNSRMHLSYQVRRFDSNNLNVTIQKNDSESSWLLYSDVWHPLWRATVNGKETPVYKANLAYKAIKLEKGSNTVNFYFKSRIMTVLYTAFGLNSLFWLVVIIFLAGRIMFKGSRGQRFQGVG